MKSNEADVEGIIKTSSDEVESAQAGEANQSFSLE
jgi:hypothetical protein